MKYLELLCPAKDYETGVAAINHGADAIYIGANQFGARKDAGNSIDDIEKLIKYAHPFNVKVYVTVNTIIYENEIAQAKLLIENLSKIGVDAIIIQDMAILEMDLPKIPVFASTQTNNTTVEKVKFLESVGFDRVILARELTLEEIKDIRSQTQIDLEFFVHGALCVSYSGQCYFSQSITGRSANRGECSQPCRSAYDLVDSSGKVLIKNKHLLSLKDLNLSDHLADLIESGISSFKIEGRLKDISYVKNITSYYSLLLNKIVERNPKLKRSSSGHCESSFNPDPERSFNRGFTTHFVEGRPREQSSMDTQKSIGKRLGIVSAFGSNWFTIKGKISLANGDGLCYINSKGVLSGLRVNRVESEKIFPFGEMKDIKIGLEVFRNFDHNFNNELKCSSQNRWIGCNLKVEQTDSLLVFSATDEENNLVAIEIPNNFDLAMNAEKSTTNIQTQLAKSGDTIFRVHHVEVKMNNPIFIPISALNQIRRDLLEQLLNKRLEQLYKPKSKTEIIESAYFESKLTYKGNISNSLSQDFYKKQGVTSIDDAYEIDPKALNLDLMVTRYCIKYELNICPTKQNGKPTGALFLKDNNDLYPLEFDCKNCVMKVKSPKK
jgi:collagenase-like PrtC family protease